MGAWGRAASSTPGRDTPTEVAQSLSIVIPVYRAGAALESTVREVLEVCGDVSPTPEVRIALDELILVCDNPGLPVEALDHLASLADLDERVRVVWLSRNFGQHPATVAGIVSTNGDWVVTMDEDGQHDPAFIQEMLATAGRNRTPLVYAEPTNTRPHGRMRNAASWVSGRVSRSVSGSRCASTASASWRGAWRARRARTPGRTCPSTCRCLGRAGRRRHAL